MGGHDAVSPDASHLRGDEDSSNSFSIPKNLSQEPIRPHITSLLRRQSNWIRTIKSFACSPSVKAVSLILLCHHAIYQEQVAVHSRCISQALDAIKPPGIPLVTPEHSTFLLSVFVLRSVELAQGTEEYGLT